MTGPQYPGQPGPDDTPRDPGQYPPPGQYGSSPQGGQYGSSPQGGQYGGQYPPPPGGQYGSGPQGGQYESAPQYSGGYQQQPPASPKNGMGIAALILGIISVLAFWTFGFGILLGIVAVILGIVGRNRAKRLEATNKGVATTGLVFGILGIIAGAVFIALSVWVFNEVGGQDLTDCLSNAGGDQAAIEQCQQDFTSNLEDRFSVTITPSP
ncbi:DUF4190 domain-containing protein [Rhodococcoides corynebacterioides]|uniref:DUF4190 domain-containing protein n=1 Tax=Rhodococcoides corynebacterioides TaxID=53972 RepID=UPI00082E3A2D|nr:DUF4190 domain-containing protein [Rhodococcus corynebacterioides]MBY6349562.1 DUF4190 domain-containing protein [Rhodococcus corynebacterioides]